MMTVSPELNPNFGSDQEFRDEAGSKVLGMRNHRAWVRCGVHAGRSPVRLNSVAQVTTADRQKTNCDAAVNVSLSCNPDGLKDWQFSSRRKLWDRQASLETATSLKGASFSDRWGGPIL